MKNSYWTENTALMSASILAHKNNKIVFVGKNLITHEFEVLESKPTETFPFDLNGDGEIVEMPLYMNVVEIHP